MGRSSRKKGSGAGVEEPPELPRVSGITWTGDPTKSGSLIMVGDDVTTAKLRAEMVMVQMAANGRPITSEVRSILADLVAREDDREEAERARRGVAPGIVKLLNAPKKQQASHLAKNLTIHVDEFIDLVKLSSSLGYVHSRKAYEWTPPALQLTPSDRADSTSERTRTRVRQIFSQRERRTVHTISCSDQDWHCFHFTFRDLFGDPNTEEHHWQCGPHVHYSSHLFSRRGLSEVTSALAVRKHAVPGEHIRYTYPRPAGEPQR